MNAILEFLKKLGAAKITALALAVVSVLSIITWLIFSAYKAPMSLLYSNLSQEDSSIITARLQSMNVQYTVSSDFGEIMVPLDKIPMLRMAFAQEGFPSSGSIVGYEIFDKSDSFGISQFIYNVNLVRALEGELSRTITSLSSVESARVHLVLPKKELFSKDATTPSASVVLKMKNNQQVNKNEIAAITHFISAAVPELKIENITIIDSKGRPLKLNTEDGEAFGVFATGMLDFKSNIESRLTKSIEDLLEKSIGVGKVKASVTADIDFDREVINTETYDPDGQVMRSHKVSEEKESDTKQSDNVSVATNLPYPGQQQPPASSKNRSRSDEITNYEISKKVSNKVSESGKIKSLSIAVLVDGTYTLEKTSDKPVYKYNPRSQDEIQQIKALITSAVGIDEKRGDKIDVVNMQFSSGMMEELPDETILDWFRGDARGLIQTAIIAIVSILSILLVIKPFLMRILDVKKEDDSDTVQDFESIMKGLEMSPQAAGIASSNFSDIGNINSDTMAMENQGDEFGHKTENNKEASIDELLNGINNNGQQNLVRYLNETVSQHLDEAVSVIRNWLYNNEE